MIAGRLCWACRLRQTSITRPAQQLGQTKWLPARSPPPIPSHRRTITLDAILREHPMKEMEEVMTATKKKQERRKAQGVAATNEDKRDRQLRWDQRYWKRVGAQKKWIDFSRYRDAYIVHARRHIPRQHQGLAIYRLNRWYIRLHLVTNNPSKTRYHAGTPVAERLLRFKYAESMQSDWESMDEEKRKTLWETMICSVMKLAPQRVHEVLRATMNPLPRGYCLSDTMWFVAQKLEVDNGSDRRQDLWKADQILRAFEAVYVDTPKGHVPFRGLSQRTVALLADKLPPDHTKRLYDMLGSFNDGQHLNMNTRLHVAAALAKTNKYKQAAFDIIMSIVAERGERVLFDMPRFSSVVTTVLSHVHKPKEGDEKLAFNVRDAIETLIEAGYTPNLIVITSFLDALCWGGELDEAIRLAGLLPKMGVPIYGRTFGSLFKAAKASLDAQKVAATLEVVKTADAPVLDAYNNALHAVYYFSEAEKPSSAAAGHSEVPSFLPILRLYAKAFKLEALQSLIPENLGSLVTPAIGSASEYAYANAVQNWQYTRTIVPVIEEFFDITGLPKLEPSPDTLAIMVRAYIRSRTKPHEVWAYYEAFKQRLSERTMRVQGQDEKTSAVDNYATQLVRVKKGVVHDTLIATLSEHEELVRYGLMILSDMLRDHQSRQESTSKEIPAAGEANILSTTSPETRASQSKSESSQSQGWGPQEEESKDRRKTVRKNAEGLTAANEVGPPANPIIHPPPSVFAFSMLIEALFSQHNGDATQQHQYAKRAQQLFQIMREQNMTPNAATWNIMVRGWAQAQNVEETVKALQGLEAAGFSPDKYTYKAFAYLNPAKQRQALRMMDEIIEQNEEEHAKGREEWYEFVRQREARRRDMEIKEEEERLRVMEAKEEKERREREKRAELESAARETQGALSKQADGVSSSAVDALEQQMMSMRRGPAQSKSSKKQKKEAKRLQREAAEAADLAEKEATGELSLFDEIRKFRRAG